MNELRKNYARRKKVGQEKMTILWFYRKIAEYTI